MTDTSVQPEPDGFVPQKEPVVLIKDSSPDSTEPPVEDAPETADSAKTIRTWVWMILVSGFGLFLVFGSVQIHYWPAPNVQDTKGMQVLDVWRAQVNGLPDVAHQAVLKSVFLVSVFGFIGLSVVALWLATVQIWNAPAADTGDSKPDGFSGAPAPDAALAPGASSG